MRSGGQVTNIAIYYDCFNINIPYESVSGL